MNSRTVTIAWTTRCCIMVNNIGTTMVNGVRLGPMLTWQIAWLQMFVAAVVTNAKNGVQNARWMIIMKAMTSGNPLCGNPVDVC